MATPFLIMRRTSRLTTVLLLLVAFLVTGLVPAVGSWSCPDGTACVYTAGRGFHCQGDECQLSCCAEKKSPHGCGRCEHSGVPGVAWTAATTERTISGKPHCQYHQGPQVERVWVTAQV